MLIKNDIISNGIVQQPQPDGQRDSTYDATVGTIISDGKQIPGTTYLLGPRGVIWVISKEDFNLPKNMTAIAALRTTWAHKGIFALNVGVVDPGWSGPVSTALVNFSTEDFEIKIGNPFMRLMFFEHKVTSPTIVPVSRSNYEKQVKKNSRNFSQTFLGMDSLVDDVARKIFSMPKIGVVATWVGLFLAVLAIFVPILFSVWGNIDKDRENIAVLQGRLEQIEKEVEKNDGPDSVQALKEQIKVLEEKLRKNTNSGTESNMSDQANN